MGRRDDEGGRRGAWHDGWLGDALGLAGMITLLVAAVAFGGLFNG